MVSAMALLVAAQFHQTRRADSWKILHGEGGAECGMLKHGYVEAVCMAVLHLWLLADPYGGRMEASVWI